MRNSQRKGHSQPLEGSQPPAGTDAMARWRSHVLEVPTPPSSINGPPQGPAVSIVILFLNFDHPVQ